MNEIIVDVVADNDKLVLTGLSHDEIGDEHIMTGVETPMVKDAFVKSDAEKKRNYCFSFYKNNGNNGVGFDR